MQFIRLLINTLEWVLKIFFHYYQLFLINKLRLLSLSNTNATLKILGNGKSLNESIEQIESETTDIMVVNKHVLSDSYRKIKPKYYVLADPYFFLKNEGVDILEKINFETDWKMILFIPSWQRFYQKTKAIFASNVNITVVPFNCMPFDGFENIKYLLYKYNLSCPLVQNVLVASIYIGINIKYETIELYGVEHNWTKSLTVNENNEVCIEDPHFYDSTKSTRRTWKEITGQNEKICTLLSYFAKMFASYIELEKFAKKENVKIINFTKGSFIDAFQRPVNT